jgi:Uma2 family endonuclease
MNTDVTTLATETRLISGDELLAMGDIGPCELIEGNIVPMSPAGGRHGRIEFTVGRHIGNFVAERKNGRVMGGETGIYTRRNPDTVRGADVLFISKERMPNEPPAGFLETAPDLVVEVLSPTTRWKELRTKLVEYLAIGVAQGWIIDPVHRAIWVYRSATDVRQFVEGDTLNGEGALEGFALPLDTLFTEH